ncbi:hypothetical protein HU200_066861 [Digitaria exilis]|uniref:Thioredoxin domain-containing protein n=1 Tax=Digitaria exilis TaxID=1010633 RepID=A0A835A155_9POAL|nr:hypothetical protein HU200_066861 [Digitaria exilis]
MKEIAAEYQIEAMPTFHFIKEGEKIDSIIGTKKNELEAKVRKHAAQPEAREYFLLVGKAGTWNGSWQRRCVRRVKLKRYQRTHTSRTPSRWPAARLPSVPPLDLTCVAAASDLARAVALPPPLPDPASPPPDPAFLLLDLAARPPDPAFPSSDPPSRVAYTHHHVPPTRTTTCRLHTPPSSRACTCHHAPPAHAPPLAAFMHALPPLAPPGAEARRCCCSELLRCSGPAPPLPLLGARTEEEEEARVREWSGEGEHGERAAERERGEGSAASQEGKCERGEMKP